MKNLVISLLTLVLALSAQSESRFMRPAPSGSDQRQSEWQQRVDYSIDVRLNDEDHTLTGLAKYTYTNNSPKELHELYFHIWPNAYKDDKTDFARQFLLNGSTNFHFAEEDELGRIDKLDFQVRGEKVKWSYYGDQIDICVLALAQPVKPGETVEIETPFFVKIPGSFSRFGHDGQSYQITQWYPKPAVFDVNGWNPMPYLNQGEFYSEFGRFEVKISVPKNYVVAATGVLQEESEKAFIQDRIENPLKPGQQPEKTNEYKTITFVQDNVHDFAWFADKKFNVSRGSVKLANGNVVETFVYADEPAATLKDSRLNIATALTYYSNHCGYYPYSHCSVVKGALKAGGGMEYPMITVVANLDEEVVIHEVGHNWFYGILGSNERLYPWMDESINSYFEYEAMHGGNDEEEISLDQGKFDLANVNDLAMNIGARQLERSELHQSIGEESKLLTGANYGLMVYGKGATAFGYLKEYLGQATLDKCFQAYFEEWKFRHPLPGDIHAVFARESGKDLNWFFKDLLVSEEHLDYKMKKVNEDGSLLVENVGGMICPYEIGYFVNGILVESQWVEGHAGAQRVVPVLKAYEVAKIDPREVMPESDRQNNSIRARGMFKKVEPLKVQGLSLVEDPNTSSLNTTPLVGWNRYNKWMLGLWVNNHVTPTNRFTFSATPLYSFATNDVNGYLNVNYKIFRNAGLRQVKLGVKGSRFAYLDGNFSYNRVVPYLTLNMRNRDKRIPISSSLTLRSSMISMTPNFDQGAEIASLAQDTGLALGRRQIQESLADQFIDLIYEYKNRKALNPSSFKATVQIGSPNMATHRFDTSAQQIIKSTASDMFAKLNVEYKKHINYKLKRKGFDLRVFGGVFLDPADNGLYHYRMESAAGKWDYTFDQVLMGRGATDGLWSRQITQTDVFLKEPGAFGNMDQWTLAVNLKSDLPVKLPLGVYLDAFTFNDIKDSPNVSEGESFIYNGGLMVKIIPKYLEVYLPLFSSNMIREAQELQGIDGLGQRITFTLNLNLFDELGIQDVLKLAGM
ncbi:MAG: M1 family metallopeptidase [Bacteroidia bacterium]|nr:M1 family metallopeptidase [Bacteroidia bacterium]